MSQEHIVVLTAADEAYIMPLTVMVQSLLENLSPGYALDLYVAEDSVTEASRKRAEDSWTQYLVRTSWIRPDKSRIPKRERDDGCAAVSAVYFRLLASELLPATVCKAIYLDADLIVQGDLSQLWNMDFKGHWTLAVPDAYADLYHLSRLSRITFRGGIRFHQDSPYFNSGVLLIDIAAWRKQRIGELALASLTDHKEEFTFRDQDALNCVLQGHWGAMSPEWNLHELPDLLFAWSARFYADEDVRRALAAPKIVHFVGLVKPWWRRSMHIRRDIFRDYLQRTRWAEDSPSCPSGLWESVLAVLAPPHGRANWLLWRGTINGREVWLKNLLRFVVKHPWMLVTYPLWQVPLWLRHVWVMHKNRQAFRTNS